MKITRYLITLLFIGFSCSEVNLIAMELSSEEVLLQKFKDFVEIQKFENPEEFKALYNRLDQEPSYVGALNNSVFHKVLDLDASEQWIAFLKDKKYSIDTKNLSLKLSTKDNTHVLDELDKFFTLQEAQNLKKYLKKTNQKDLTLLIKFLTRRFEIKKMMQNHVIIRVQEMIIATTEPLQKFQDWLDTCTIEHFFRYTDFRYFLDNNFSLNIILQINQLIDCFMENQNEIDSKQQQFTSIKLSNVFSEFYKLLCDVSSKANNLKSKTEKKTGLPIPSFS